MKFKKKPVVIEAFQMTKELRNDFSSWPQWLVDAWSNEIIFCSETSDGKDEPTFLEIKTLEGNHLIRWDDYIIQGVQGELYPCKPDIFKVSYEAVTDNTITSLEASAMKSGTGMTGGTNGIGAKEEKYPIEV